MKRAAAMLSAALAIAFVAAPPSRAGDAPSDNDLRAAYCLRLTEASIALMDAAPKAVTPMLEQLRNQVKRKQEEKRDHLQAYFKPRQAVLERDVVRDALKTVDADAKVDNAGRRSILDACATQCKTANPPPTQEGRACIDACAKEDPVVKRLDRCTTLEWLPGDAVSK